MTRVYRQPQTSVDTAIAAALDGHEDGRTAVELTEVTGMDYVAILGALERLAAGGVVQRGTARIGSWTLVNREAA